MSVYLYIYTTSHPSKYSQPSANIDITARDLGSSKKGMTAVTSGASNLDGVATAVRFGGVERYDAALVAVGSVRRPSRLVPAALEIVGDLCQRQWKQRESGEAKKAEHDGGWKMNQPGEPFGSVCKTLLG